VSSRNTITLVLDCSLLLSLSAGGVAHIIGVSRNPQILVNASLDAVAAASESDIDAAVHVTVGVFAAVDLVRVRSELEWTGSFPSE
jgi:hypothetical protein